MRAAAVRALGQVVRPSDPSRFKEIDFATARTHTSSFDESLVLDQVSRSFGENQGKLQRSPNNLAQEFLVPRGHRVGPLNGVVLHRFVAEFDLAEQRSDGVRPIAIDGVELRRFH